MNPRIGQCRRGPPQHSMNSRDLFPMVTEYAWCGEFKPKEAVKEDTGTPIRLLREG